MITTPSLPEKKQYWLQVRNRIERENWIDIDQHADMYEVLAQLGKFKATHPGRECRAISRRIQEATIEYGFPKE